MPKNYKRKSRRQQAIAVNDDDDTGSISSDQTESTNPASDDETITTEIEDYENKIKEVLDLAFEKSMQTRINALISLKTALQKRIVTAFLVENYVTITDIIERGLKKGKAAEQIAAAKLASVFVICLQSTDETEKVYKTLYPVLIILTQDPSAHLSARQEAVATLSILAFYTSPEPTDLTDALNVLHTIFCSALPKGNGELPNHSAGMNALTSTALEGVCLLMTLLSPTTVYTMAQKFLKEFQPVLRSPDLELRISVGEALALVYECARLHSDNFRWKRQGEIVTRLEELASDSNKYRAKRDRRTQRTSFREIISTITRGDSIMQSVYVGPSKMKQELILDSYSLRIQYEALCGAFEQGLSYHMTYNVMIRDQFDLGPPPELSQLKLLKAAQKRSSKQTPEVKARILARNKNRDNRAADFDYDD